MSKLWFKAKNYGYGWYPVTWEGWLCILIYVIVISLVALVAYSLFQVLIATLIYILTMIPATLLLIWIAYKKGEKVEWRWAGKKIKR